MWYFFAEAFSCLKLLPVFGRLHLINKRKTTCVTFTLAEGATSEQGRSQDFLKGRARAEIFINSGK